MENAKTKEKKKHIIKTQILVLSWGWLGGWKCLRHGRASWRNPAAASVRLHAALPARADEKVGETLSVLRRLPVHVPEAGDGAVRRLHGGVLLRRLQVQIHHAVLPRKKGEKNRTKCLHADGTVFATTKRKLCFCSALRLQSATRAAEKGNWSRVCRWSGGPNTFVTWTACCSSAA